MEMCFEMLIKELQKAQLALSSAYQTELCLRDMVINAVRDVSECSMACFKPAATFEDLCADIRA
ncbi:integrase and RNaseH domain-containing protein [Golovinomyces cichoracearum]|uniref:Integrase and RNaseH domain-containing protein n=1 Tax=Golovinomyces cichoracearum TaxID=62708 RepID=A0A420IH06_9PEZI|nr:integrase and RNaseH domain-containing protein [Golovinomyces cichoracearum]